MSTYHSFDEKGIQETLDTARNHFADMDVSSLGATSDLSSNGHMLLHSQCIAVTVEKGKVCLSLPLGFGKVCLPIPIKFPDGTAAQACLKICTTWGVPTGIKVSVEIAGITVVSQTYGKC
jgi:hypothetical protein